MPPQVGVATLGLWFCQLLVGIYVHVLCEKPSDNLLKFHRFLGKVTFASGLATCALGLQDMQVQGLRWGVGAGYMCLGDPGQAGTGPTLGWVGWLHVPWSSRTCDMQVRGLR